MQTFKLASHPTFRVWSVLLLATLLLIPFSHLGLEVGILKSGQFFGLFNASLFAVAILVLRQRHTAQELVAYGSIPVVAIAANALLFPGSRLVFAAIFLLQCVTTAAVAWCFSKTTAYQVMFRGEKQTPRSSELTFKHLVIVGLVVVLVGIVQSALESDKGNSIELSMMFLLSAAHSGIAMLSWLALSHVAVRDRFWVLFNLTLLSVLVMAIAVSAKVILNDSSTWTNSADSNSTILLNTSLQLMLSVGPACLIAMALVQTGLRIKRPSKTFGFGEIKHPTAYTWLRVSLRVLAKSLLSVALIYLFFCPTTEFKQVGNSTSFVEQRMGWPLAIYEQSQQTDAIPKFVRFSNWNGQEFTRVALLINGALALWLLFLVWRSGSRSRHLLRKLRLVSFGVLFSFAVYDGWWLPRQSYLSEQKYLDAGFVVDQAKTYTWARSPVSTVLDQITRNSTSTFNPRYSTWTSTDADDHLLSKLIRDVEPTSLTLLRAEIGKQTTQALRDCKVGLLTMRDCEYAANDMQLALSQQHRLRRLIVESSMTSFCPEYSDNNVRDLTDLSVPIGPEVNIHDLGELHSIKIYASARITTIRISNCPALELLEVHTDDQVKSVDVQLDSLSRLWNFTGISQSATFAITGSQTPSLHSIQLLADQTRLNRRGTAGLAQLSRLELENHRADIRLTAALNHDSVLKLASLLQYSFSVDCQNRGLPESLISGGLPSRTVGFGSELELKNCSLDAAAFEQLESITPQTLTILSSEMTDDQIDVLLASRKIRELGIPDVAISDAQLNTAVSANSTLGELTFDGSKIQSLPLCTKRMRLYGRNVNPDLKLTETAMVSYDFLQLVQERGAGLHGHDYQNCLSSVFINKIDWDTTGSFPNNQSRRFYCITKMVPGNIVPFDRAYGYDFEGSGVRDQDLERFLTAHMKGECSLSPIYYLSFKNCDVSMEIIGKLARECRNLNYLDLSNVDINTELCELGYHPNLIQLSLRGRKVTEKDVERLRALPYGNQLDLRDCSMSREVRGMLYNLGPQKEILLP